MSPKQEACPYNGKGLVGTHGSQLWGDDVQQQTEHLQDKRLLPRTAAGAGCGP